MDNTELHPGPELESLNHSEYKITLQMKVFGPKDIRYRWRRSDGVWASPEFDKIEDAVDYPKTTGFGVFEK